MPSAESSRQSIFCEVKCRTHLSAWDELKVTEDVWMLNHNYSNKINERHCMAIQADIDQLCSYSSRCTKAKR